MGANRFGAVLLAWVLLCVVCRAAEAVLDGGSVTLVVAQRATGSVPGTDDSLQVTLGDITAGQVQVTVVAIVGRGTGEEKRVVLVPATSMRRGETLEFRHGGRERVLMLVKLYNALIGTDTAVFRYGPKPAEIVPPKPLPPTQTL